MLSKGPPPGRSARAGIYGYCHAGIYMEFGDFGHTRRLNLVTKFSGTLRLVRKARGRSVISSTSDIMVLTHGLD